MSDFAPDAQAAAAHAPVRARSTFCRGFPGDLSRCSDLGGFVLSGEAGVFVLGAVAPDGGLLLPHQGYVAAWCGGGAGAGGGVAAEGGGDVGGGALGEVGR